MYDNCKKILREKSVGDRCWILDEMFCSEMASLFKRLSQGCDFSTFFI